MPHPCGLIHIRPSVGTVYELKQRLPEIIERNNLKFARQLMHILRLKTPLVCPRITDMIVAEELFDCPNQQQESEGEKQCDACTSHLVRMDTLVSKLGLRDPEDAVEQFVRQNTRRKKRKTQVIWVCPLSGKKFLEPVFVRKHIMHKYMHKVIEAKKDNATFFNNFLLDPWRSQNVLRLHRAVQDAFVSGDKERSRGQKPRSHTRSPSRRRRPGGPQSPRRRQQPPHNRRSRSRSSPRGRHPRYGQSGGRFQGRFGNRNQGDRRFDNQNRNRPWQQSNNFYSNRRNGEGKSYVDLDAP